MARLQPMSRRASARTPTVRPTTANAVNTTSGTMSKLPPGSAARVRTATGCEPTGEARAADRRDRLPPATPAPPRPRSPRVASPRRSHSRRRRNGVDHRRREPDGRPPGCRSPASGTRVRTSMLVRVSERSSSRVPCCTGSTLPDDRDPVAQGLHFGKDVARQQHRRQRLRGCTTGTPIPSAGRGPMLVRPRAAGPRADDNAAIKRDLLPVPLGIGAALLAQVECEPFDQVVTTSLIDATAQPPKQVDDLAA